MTVLSANQMETPPQQVVGLNQTNYEPGVFEFTHGCYMKPPQERAGEAEPQREEESQEDMLAAARTEERASEFATRLLDFKNSALREECANCRKDHWKLSEVPSQHQAVQDINSAVDEIRSFISQYVSESLQLAHTAFGYMIFKGLPLFEELMTTRHPLADVAFHNRHIVYSMFRIEGSFSLTREEINKKLGDLSLNLKKPVFKSEKSD